MSQSWDVLGMSDNSVLSDKAIMRCIEDKLSNASTLACGLSIVTAAALVSVPQAAEHMDREAIASPKGSALNSPEKIGTQTRRRSAVDRKAKRESRRESKASKDKIKKEKKNKSKLKQHINM